MAGSPSARFGLCVCLCIFVFVYLYICICIYVSVFMYLYLCIYIYVFVFVFKPSSALFMSAGYFSCQSSTQRDVGETFIRTHGAKNGSVCSAVTRLPGQDTNTQIQIYKNTKTNTKVSALL